MEPKSAISKLGTCAVLPASRLRILSGAFILSGERFSQFVHFGVDLVGEYAILKFLTAPCCGVAKKPQQVNWARTPCCLSVGSGSCPELLFSAENVFRSFFIFGVDFALCVRYLEGPGGTFVQTVRSKSLHSVAGAFRAEAPVSRPRFMTGVLFFAALSSAVVVEYPRSSRWASLFLSKKVVTSQPAPPLSSSCIQSLS